MPDTLVLSEVEATGRLGVYEWERKSPQSLWVDVELRIDAARAAGSDAVADAVDYATLVTRIRVLAKQQAYRLLETLAEAIAATLLTESGSRWIRVRVKKKALPGVGYAAVEVERAAPRRALRVNGRGRRRGVRAGAR